MPKQKQIKLSGWDILYHILIFITYVWLWEALKMMWRGVMG